MSRCRNADIVELWLIAFVIQFGCRRSVLLIKMLVLVLFAGTLLLILRDSINSSHIFLSCRHQCYIKAAVLLSSYFYSNRSDHKTGLWVSGTSRAASTDLRNLLLVLSMPVIREWIVLLRPVLYFQWICKDVWIHSYLFLPLSHWIFWSGFSVSGTDTISLLCVMF